MQIAIAIGDVSMRAMKGDASWAHSLAQALDAGVY
jgi:hypothetical protein